MNPDYGGVLTIDELSVYLKVPKSTLYKLAQEHRVPGQKVGRHWRFRKARIDRWLDTSESNVLEHLGEHGPAGPTR